MKNQEQTATEKPVICKVELFDFLMTLHSLVNSMTTVLLCGQFYTVPVPYKRHMGWRAF